MLDKLKEYKELIAIIVFFIGGFFWLQSQYPNKTDLKLELATVRCQLSKYMEMTQMQIRNQNLEKQLLDLKKKLSKVPSSNGRQSEIPLSPAMQLEIQYMKDAYKTKKKQLEQLENNMIKLRDELARGACGRSKL